MMVVWIAASFLIGWRKLSCELSIVISLDELNDKTGILRLTSISTRDVSAAPAPGKDETIFAFKKFQINLINCPLFAKSSSLAALHHCVSPQVFIVDNFSSRLQTELQSTRRTGWADRVIFSPAVPCLQTRPEQRRARAREGGREGEARKSVCGWPRGLCEGEVRAELC